MKSSIATKLILAIGCPLLAVYLGMALCEYHIGRKESLAAMESHLTDLIVGQAADIDGDLKAAEEFAKTTASILATSPEFTAERLHALLRDGLRLHPDIFGTCIALEKNQIPGRTAPFAPYYCRDERGGLRFVDIAEVFPNYIELSWYRPAKENGCPFWTEPYFDTDVGEKLMCTYTVPLIRNDEFLGVLTVDLLSERLLAEIARRKIGSGYCTLVSKQGTFVSHPDPVLPMKESIFSLAKQNNRGEIAQAGEEMVAGKTGTKRIRDYRSDEPKWMVFAPVQSTGWSLAAIIPESEVMASVYARMARLLALLGAGLFVILSIVVLVSNRITRPIRQVASAAESIGRGNLESRAPDMRGNDEVACLARTFNAMVSDLKTNIECRIQEESARREVEGELEAARRIQASLLPAPLPPNATQAFALKAINLPAKSVAGDFYDFFFLDAGRLALVVADVSGKGVPAAMYMAVSRTKLRDFASRELSPAEVLSRVNRSLTLENESEMFVSMFLGYYDVRTGELIYANAGHNPPYLVRENGILDSLAPTGPLVAVFPDADFQNANCRLNPNDLLVLYTDGITEADRNGHLYGEERLEKMLTSSWTSSPEDLSRTIVDNAREFANGELADDATVLVLKRRALA